MRSAVTTGEAVVALGARPERGRGNRHRRRRQHRRATAVALPPSAASSSTSTTLNAAQASDRLRAARPDRGEGKGGPDPGLARNACSEHASASRRRTTRDAVRRTRARANAPASRPFSRAERESSVQLVTVVGEPGIGKSRLVTELRERARRSSRSRDLATRALPALRRGNHFLGARRDREVRGRDPRVGRLARGQGEARRDDRGPLPRRRRASLVRLEARAARGGCGSEAPPSPARSRSRPGGDSSRRWRRDALAYSWSRTCTGRTMFSSISSSISSTGACPSRCSFSAPRVPSSSSAARAGAAESATRPRSPSPRSRPRMPPGSFSFSSTGRSFRSRRSPCFSSVRAATRSTPSSSPGCWPSVTTEISPFRRRSRPSSRRGSTHSGRSSRRFCRTPRWWGASSGADP